MSKWRRVARIEAVSDSLNVEPDPLADDMPLPEAAMAAGVLYVQKRQLEGMAEEQFQMTYPHEYGLLQQEINGMASVSAPPAINVRRARGQQ